MATKSDSAYGMVTGVFRNHTRSQEVYDRLRGRGYADSDINVLMSDATRTKYYSNSNLPVDGESSDENPAGTMATEGMGVGGAIGTVVGAALGALAAVGTTLALPGLGIVIAGPIAAALAGAGAGSATGGLLGGLIGLGIPESNANAYEAALKDGGVVIGVNAHSKADATAIKKDFEDLGGENVVTVAA